MCEVEFSLQVESNADLLLSWGGEKIRMSSQISEEPNQLWWDGGVAAGGGRHTVGRLPPGLVSTAVHQVDHVLDAVAGSLGARLEGLLGVTLEALVRLLPEQNTRWPQWGQVTRAVRNRSELVPTFADLSWVKFSLVENNPVEEGQVRSTKGDPWFLSVLNGLLKGATLLREPADGPRFDLVETLARKERTEERESTGSPDETLSSPQQ